MSRSWFGKDSMTLLEVSKLVNYTRGDDKWIIRVLFVTGWAVIAPYSGLGSLINKTTSFEIDSRLSG